jgi:hypothetical protein
MLIDDVERTFGLKISNKEAEKIHTAGELADYIQKRVPARFHGSADRCLTAHEFYFARNRIGRCFNLDRSTLGPDFSMQNLLPENAKEARRRWKVIGEILDVELPKLGRPLKVLQFMAWTCLITFIAGSVFSWIHKDDYGPIYFCMTSFSMFLIIPLMRLMTRHHARFVLRGFRTLSQVSSLRIGPDMEKFRKKSAWTRLEIWQWVQWQTAARVQISPASVDQNDDWLDLDLE